MKAILRILSALLALVLCMSSFAGCASANRPLKYLKSSAEQTVSQSLLGDLLGFLLNTVQNGSVAVEFGGTDIVQGLPEAADIKLWLDAEARKLAADGSLTLDGTVYDAALWVTDTEAILSSPAFLGSTTVGVDFTTLQNDLKTSIFANNSGTIYARPNVSDATATSVTALKDGVFTVLGSSKDLLKLSDKALDVFLAQLTEYASSNFYKKDGRTYVSLSVNNDALSRALRETRAKLVKSRSFCRDLREYAKTLDAIRAAKEGVVTNEYSTKLEYFITSEADIDAICLKIDNALPFVFDLNATVHTFGRSIEEVDCSFTQDGTRRLDARLFLAKDGGVSTLAVTFDGVSRELSYQVTKDSFRYFGAELSYKRSAADKEPLLVTGSLSADRREDSYSLTLKKGESTRTFGGRYAFDDEELSLSVEQCVVNGEAKKLALSITVKAQEDAPQKIPYVNVVSMEATRYEHIDTRMKQTKESFLAAWESAQLTPYTTLAELLTILGVEEEIPAPPEVETEDEE